MCQAQDAPAASPPPTAATARRQHLGALQSPTFPHFAAAMPSEAPAGRGSPPPVSAPRRQDRPSSRGVARRRQPTCLHRRLQGRADRGAAGTAVPRKPLRAPTAPAGGVGQRPGHLRAGNPNHRGVGSGCRPPLALTCGLGREAGASLHSAARPPLSWGEKRRAADPEAIEGRAGPARANWGHCRGGGHAAPAALPAGCPAPAAMAVAPLCDSTAKI